MQGSMRLIQGKASFAIEIVKECDCLAFLLTFVQEEGKAWVLILVCVNRIEVRILRKWISVMKQKGSRRCE